MLLSQIVLLSLILLLLMLVGLLIYVLFGLYITAQGPPFVPLSDERLEKLLKLATVNKNTRVIDFGSGDGRVLIALAEVGATGDGYEINPWLVKQSRRAIAKAGLADHLTIHRRSMWDSDLSQYDLITVYGIGRIMERLQHKIWDECKPGTKVISSYFQFPDWEPTKKSGEVRLYVV